MSGVAENQARVAASSRNQASLGAGVAGGGARPCHSCTWAWPAASSGSDCSGTR
ncbi:MAG: hypothetical protein WC708_09615 [Lentisphaeria bacterium]